jgi:hypothetical protein
VLLVLPAVAPAPPITPDTIQALVPRPFRSAVPERLLKADYTVLGRVRRIEPELTLAAAGPDDVYQSAFRIAVIQVQELISGAEGLPELRVGFRPVRHARHRHLELAVGDEGCFFLKRHEEQPFWTLQPAVRPAGSARPDPFFLRPDSLGYAKEIELARRCARLLRNARDGLTAESAEDRLLTAALLVKRYRGDPNPLQWFRPGGLNTQPIDAEESRLILSVLAAADLTAGHPEVDVSALGVFGQLGLEPADGWELTFDRSAIPEKARAWLKAHAGLYRIQRVLPWARGMKEFSGLAAALIQ